MHARERLCPVACLDCNNVGRLRNGSPRRDGRLSVSGRGARVDGRFRWRTPRGRPPPPPNSPNSAISNNDEWLREVCLDVDGLCWLWASPVSITEPWGSWQPITVPQTPSPCWCPGGIRYATDEEFTAALPKLEARRNEFYAKCASKALDPQFAHCDSTNSFKHKPNDSLDELVLICDEAVYPPLPESKCFPSPVEEPDLPLEEPEESMPDSIDDAMQQGAQSDAVQGLFSAQTLGGSASLVGGRGVQGHPLALCVGAVAAASVGGLALRAVAMARRSSYAAGLIDCSHATHLSSTVVSAVSDAEDASVQEDASPIGA